MRRELRGKLSVVLVVVFLLVVVGFGLILPMYGSRVHPVGEGKRGGILGEHEFVPGEVLLGFVDGIDENLIVEHGGTLVKLIHQINVAVVRVPIGSEESFIRKALSSEVIRFAERNGYCKAGYIPGDPHYSDQWHYPRIECPEAWDITKGSGSVTVAVVDSGVDYDHPDLDANMWTEVNGSHGYDFVNDDTYPMDDHGHGTHCAGIIAAEMNNGEGGTGVAPNCKIMAVKVLDADGFGLWDDIASGILYAADNYANVISMSLGGYDYSSAVEAACEHAYDTKGCLLVAVAGNDALPIVMCPAIFETVIAVSAIDFNNDPADFTNYGPEIELCAPGGGDLNGDGDYNDPNEYVYSTLWDDTYGGPGWAGTSMATPHVSAVAALIWSRFPGMTRDDVRNQLRLSADDLGDVGFDMYHGYGRVNARRAVSVLITSWPMFRHDLSHTGYSTSTAPNTNNTIWNYTTGDWVCTSPAVADGKVFVGSNDSNVYALDQHTGAHIWNYTTGSIVRSSPAVADGKVYVGSYDHKVYCLDATTGEHIWNYTTGDWVESSPAVAYSRVYVGSADGKVYCLDATNGANIWKYTTGGAVWSSPAVVDGKVYVGSWDNKVYCLDATTGEHIWNYTTGSYVTSSPAVADGKVYVGSVDNKTYCLDTSTGSHIWNYTTGFGVVSSPAVAYGKVYVGSYDDKVYCLRASDGYKEWEFTTGGYVGSSPAVANGKVYVGSDKLYCLDATNGANIWSYTTGGYVTSSPAVVDGKVYVGSHDNKVYAFGPPSQVHDVAITDVIPSRTAIAQGYTMYINVAVGNQGYFPENFNVTAYANTTAIQTLNVTNLPPGNSTTLTFTWNTTGVTKGNYTITATATPVLGETDTVDNTYPDGWVVVTCKGDANGDGVINIYDWITVAINFGNAPPKPPECDVNFDGVVNVLDWITVAVSYGPC